MTVCFRKHFKGAHCSAASILDIRGDIHLIICIYIIYIHIYAYAYTHAYTCIPMYLCVYMYICRYAHIRIDVSR